MPEIMSGEQKLKTFSRFIPSHKRWLLTFG